MAGPPANQDHADALASAMNSTSYQIGLASADCDLLLTSTGLELTEATRVTQSRRTCFAFTYG